MSTSLQDMKHGKPVFYQIKIEGKLRENWSDWLNSMEIATGKGFDDAQTTTLVGKVTDQAALRGILPATIGLSVAMALQMAQPVFTRAYQEGSARLGANLFIMACSGFLLAANLVSPVIVLLLAGAAAALAMAVIPAKVKTQPAGTE